MYTSNFWWYYVQNYHIGYKWMMNVNKSGWDIMCQPHNWMEGIYLKIIVPQYIYFNLVTSNYKLTNIWLIMWYMHINLNLVFNVGQHVCNLKMSTCCEPTLLFWRERERGIGRCLKVQKHRILCERRKKILEM